MEVFMAATFYELIIKGNEDLLYAYLHGFMSGRKIEKGIIFSNEHPLAIHHLREFLEYRGEVLHLVCRARLRASVISAVESAPKDYSFELKKEQRIASASFSFEFETFNREAAGNLKKIFASLPKGLKLVAYEPEESIHPDAAGPEGYAPMHEYRFHGKGNVLGDVETLLDFHEQLSHNDFIKLEEIRLDY
jgi:hypothetical protein